MSTVAQRIIEFNKSLAFTAQLPPGIRVMNPFTENPSAVHASSLFYQKYYNDDEPRHMLLGINPGRFGAGLTGVPFTDPKRLQDVCGIKCFDGPLAHEPSSVFIYEMIHKYGGPDKFYKKFYINTICPLGFVSENAKGKEINYNYYDSKELTEASYSFAVDCINRQLDFNIRRDVCFCLGTGKNMKFLVDLNKAHKFFDKIVALEHPRYVIQYKSKHMADYICKYLEHFRNLQN